MNPFSPSEAIINSQEMGEKLGRKERLLGISRQVFHRELLFPLLSRLFLFFFFLKTVARAMNGDDLIHSLGLNIAISD